jgi:hypothetical protein
MQILMGLTIAALALAGCAPHPLLAPSASALPTVTLAPTASPLATASPDHPAAAFAVFEEIGTALL